MGLAYNCLGVNIMAIACPSKEGTVIQRRL
jgi:hypothetical protein